MDYTGRYFSARDMRLLYSFTAELYGDIVQVTVNLFKISALNTATNIYGEASQASGKTYYPPIEMTALVEHPDIDTDDGDKFGPDRNQNVVFRFRQKMLTLVEFVPQVGDIIQFNNRYYECDNVVEEQFFGGQPSKSYSVIVNTHYSRLSKLNIIDRQS